VSVSVIIPIASEAEPWRELLLDLVSLDESDECILVSPDNLNDQLQVFLNKFPFRASVRFITSPRGRAIQQNTAAQMAKNHWLWFLHCDSLLGQESLPTLKNELLKDENKLYFFNLKFSDPKFMLIRLNELGVIFRSKVLRIPFGDQGFCLKKKTFEKLGGYNPNVQYGEDHLLVWRAHQEGVPLELLEATIYTSPRKYQQKGWLKVSFDHVRKTFIQATPELMKLLKANHKEKRN
jgi:hypothetical protein